jgi:hypothetical protein
MKKITPIIFITVLVIIFFWQLFFKGLLPIPSDTVVGLYHPFRDLYAKNYPNGIPFKNFLITDPVRQQFPWRDLAVSAERKLELPLWNPYGLSGTPLLANFQSGSFYILNILFFVMSFSTAWSLIIFLGPLMAGIMMFAYLNNFKLNKFSSLLGSISYAFCGFFVAWMEWGTIINVALWLPLILLSIDKLIITKRKTVMWSIIYLLSLVSGFFAGHLQVFSYLGIFSFLYFVTRWFQFGKNGKVFTLYVSLNLIFLALTSAQWIPTFQFIILSARNIDLVDFNTLGWFIPWQHLIQFVAPDYFGNPTTLNYWGVWNYGELVGYVGIAPLILAMFAMLRRRDKKTLFFGAFFFLALIFSLPTFFAKIPYILKIPFLSTSQPTRLLFIVDFSLAVLSALGFDYLLKVKKNISIIYPLIFVAVILTLLWIFIPTAHLPVVKSNLLLPTLLFMSSVILLIGLIIFRKNNKTRILICTLILILVSFDLIRFGWKFTPFTNRNYLFPSTKTIDFLKSNLGDFRIMTTDSRILPPNFSAAYRLQSIDGYDPLYLLRYGELIAASERNKADIRQPFGFNRIITPHNFESKIIDLLGVKYVLSLSQLNSSKLIRVFQEGQTIVYENRNVIPRAFFVKNIKLANNKKESMEILFDPSVDLTQSGVVENGNNNLTAEWSIGVVDIVQYSENEIIINTKNDKAGFLILTDSYFPTWKATIDDNLTRVYLTDYNFRGIIIPSGRHKIKFYNTLF